MPSGGYRPAGLRRAPEWARLPAACCSHVPNLCDGIPGRFVILPLSVEGSLLRPEPSMIWTSSVEGSPLDTEPSMKRASSVEGYRAHIHAHFHAH